MTLKFFCILFKIQWLDFDDFFFILKSSLKYICGEKIIRIRPLNDKLYANIGNKNNFANIGATTMKHIPLDLSQWDDLNDIKIIEIQLLVAELFKNLYKIWIVTQDLCDLIDRETIAKPNFIKSFI